MQYIDEIKICNKCRSLGVDYIVERRDNLDYSICYKPDIIEYLWILESPPYSSPPRYFYRPELTRYDSLFREIMKSLNIEIGISKNISLSAFEARGHFLIDCAKCPIDKDNSHLKSAMMSNCANILREELLVLNPKNILVVKSSLYQRVSKLLMEIKMSSRLLNEHPIPFPGSGNQIKFRNAIGRYLNIAQTPNINKPPQPIDNKKQSKEYSNINSIIISNITEKDVKKKQIRITTDNKPLFPIERRGFPETHQLKFVNNDEQFNVIYVIGSKDGRSRSGVLKLGIELYQYKLNIGPGTGLKITKIEQGLYHIEQL